MQDRLDRPQTTSLDREQLMLIFAVVGVVGVYALMIGFTYPAIAFNLEARGFSSSAIGAQMAMSGVGIIVASALTPALVVRYGAWPVAVLGLLVTVAAMIGFGLIQNPWLWYPLRLVLSASGAVLFVVSETWVNQLAPEHLRGRIIGFYTSVISGLFALGPLLVPVLGFEGTMPFVTVGVGLLVLGAPILLLRGRTPDIEHLPPGVMRTTFMVIPLLLFVVICFGFFDAAVLALWGIYALAGGADVERAAALVTALIIGNVLLQVPLGWLADRFSRRRLLSICALAGLAGAAGLEFVDLTGWFIFPYLFVWGALAFGTYTIAMTLIGEKLTGTQLVAASAGFSIMWGVGNLVGAAITGPLMDVMGPVGFPVSIAAVYSLLFVATLVMDPVRVALLNLQDAVPAGGTPGAPNDPRKA